ncbi:hypothetical protein K491DRAFT_649926 [Lophiostoma macrostomum CBS 122681]|uniref:Heterokaryon incompatibility domain-containing protein n=1 Tax=Lophiostoma macrostomum CBS 122681 TaxID=1314788 RepID=A0A6A6TJD9_9PLEO|nr:hypothetical protein K491DRAFT_649926 [Lophiostoma macrostomum CBS 122681]
MATQDDDTETFYGRLHIPPKSRCIRLLHVQGPDPNVAADGGPIYCDVAVVDLDSDSTWTALSYVWGTMASEPDVIFCNQTAFRVTSNCYSALRHLRQILGSFTIWVDAICINQADNLEKGHQVGLMDDIYSRAGTTYIWIGEGSESTERVVKLLSNTGFLEYFLDANGQIKPRVWAAYLSYVMAQWGLKRSTLPILERGCYIPRFSIANLLQPFRKEPLCTVHELHEFFQCSWITRIWTFQEVLMPNNPIVVCGLSQIAWSRLELSIAFLASIRTPGFTVNIRTWDNRHLRSGEKWLNVVFARDAYRTKVKDSSKHNSHLRNYWLFCISIGRAHRNLNTLLILVFFTFVWSIYFAMYKPRGGQLATSLFWLIIGTPVAIVGAGLSVHVLFYTFAPGPSFYNLAVLHKSVTSRINRDFRTRILTALCTRNATDPRDFSFGIRSVLQRSHLGTQLQLPPADYSISKAEAYKQFTMRFFQGQRVTKLLPLALQHRCEGAPSWVPDFSKRLEISPGKIYMFSDVTEGSQSYQRWNSEDKLILKGLVFQEIHSVTKHDTRGWSFKAHGGYSSFASRPVRDGDKLALISGMPCPVVLRDKGNSFELVSAANVTRWWLFGMTSALWKSHNKQKRAKWKEIQGTGLPPGTVVEDDPGDYLDDILIS